MTIGIEVKDETVEVISQEEELSIKSEGTLIKGDDGASAYEVAVANGFEGTETEWLTSLHGKDGKEGQAGYTPQKGIDYFDGKDGQNGSNGKDGTSPIVSVSTITGGHRITITDANGTKTFDVMDGSDGEDGSDGATGSAGSNGSDGVGIQSVKQTTTSTADGGNNIITVTLTNGQSATFTVKNGSTGAAGKNGSDANVTATNIKNALGYIPANASDVIMNAAGTGVDGNVPVFDTDGSLIRDGGVPLSSLAEQGEVTQLSKEVADLKAKLVDGNEVAY